MPVNPLADAEIKSIDHLGLVAAAIESLDLVGKIDQRLPLTENGTSKVTHGQRVKAMIINGLGYTASPLYITPDFFEHKDVSRLIGPGVEIAHLNDFALGRTLDAIYAYGTTKLFAEIAFEVAQERELLGHSLHIDTTTLTLHGDYLKAAELAEAAEQMSAAHAETLTDVPLPALGYSKAHRHDLKQVVMSLTVTGKAKMPLWFEALPGNSSDKANFHDSIAMFEAFKKQIAMADSFLWVADAALYDSGKLQASNIKWLTRIPQTKGYAKQLVLKPDKDIDWEELNDGYKAATYEVGDDEKWALIYSQQAYQRELKTLERKVAKAKESAAKSLKKLCQAPYACAADAMKAAKQWLKGQRFHCAEFTVEPREHYNKPGKPAKGAKPDRVDYHLRGSISDDHDAQSQYACKLGRFVLGSNDTGNSELTAQVMLDTYKEQNGVEKCFRFTKSDEFQLDGIYLKLPSRIDALMMVMTLSLMVYNSAEYQMRETMNERGITLPNQKKKQTATPTLRWVFQMMQGVYSLNMAGTPTHVSGVNEKKEKIIRLFGKVACEIYGIAC